MDHDGADHKCGSTTRLLHVANHVRDTLHARLDVAFRRDAAGPEREAMSNAVWEFRDDADAVEEADNLIAGAEVAQLTATGPPVLDHDRGVHPLAFDLEPLALVPNPGVVIAGRVEVVWRAPIGRGRLQGRVAFDRRPAAEGEQFLEQVLHRRGRRRSYAHLKPGKIVVGATDGKFEHLEGATVLHHGIEDLRHQTGIDEVSLGLDNFTDAVISAHARSALPAEKGRTGPSPPAQPF